jgi:hypothetical protein
MSVEIHVEKIPRAMIEDALARLRGLHDDEARFTALEQYGQLKFFLANELWDKETLSLAPGSRDQTRPFACRDGQVQSHVLAEEVALSAADMPSTIDTQRKIVRQSRGKHRWLEKRRSSIVS